MYYVYIVVLRQSNEKYIMEMSDKATEWPVLQNIPTVINGVRCGDSETVARALEDISQSIQDMTEKFKLIHGNLNERMMTISHWIYDTKHQ